MPTSKEPGHHPTCSRSGPESSIQQEQGIWLRVSRRKKREDIRVQSPMYHRGCRWPVSVSCRDRAT